MILLVHLKDFGNSDTTLLLLDDIELSRVDAPNVAVDVQVIELLTESLMQVVSSALDFDTLPDVAASSHTQVKGGRPETVAKTVGCLCPSVTGWTAVLSEEVLW